VQTTTPTLWVGTNAGTVYVFTINIPGGERRSKEDVGCQIAKEIQLKHRAPVLSVIILDCNSCNVEGFSPQHDHLGPHKVIIASEEQVKIFTLPALRPFGKLKLTAQEGSRLRAIRVQTFVSSADSSYSEKCLSCITNQGDVYIITVPDLRKQIVFHQLIKREDITGISSFTLNEFGEAVYQISSSELQRISLSISGAVFPRCSIDGKFDESKHKAVETNHVVPRPSTSPSTSNNAQMDDATEPGDITIDSVRDHTNSSPIPPTVSSTT
jgi:lethal(2) giant larvae protein